MDKHKDLVVILKNPGTSCNIGCTYCAEERKKVVCVDKAVSLENIKQLLKCCPEDMQLTILFHGGEPTILPIAYYEEIITYCRMQREDIVFGLQSNAVRLDDEWIEFILRHREYMGVSISLDGTEEMNAYRKDKQGQPTFHRVKESLRKLERNNIKTGMISTLTNISLGHEEDLIELIQEFSNIRFLKLNPCYDLWSNGEIPQWGITPIQYNQFVIKFFDLMVEKNLFGKIDVEPMLSVIKNIEGVGSSFCNYSSNKCNHFVSLYPSGILTSCDNYNTEEGYIGSLYEIENIFEVSEFQNNVSLKEDIMELLAECKQCSNQVICTGGCLAARRRYKKYYQGEDKNIYCEAISNMIEHINKCISKFRGEA